MVVYFEGSTGQPLQNPTAPRSAILSTSATPTLTRTRRRWVGIGVASQAHLHRSNEFRSKTLGSERNLSTGSNGRGWLDSPAKLIFGHFYIFLLLAFHTTISWFANMGWSAGLHLGSQTQGSTALGGFRPGESAMNQWINGLMDQYECPEQHLGTAYHSFLEGKSGKKS